MPVTAKLSSEFYDKLGDKVANELVNWFNQVDATYRSELKDLFEVHFSRFDAKLEERAAQLDAKLDQRVTQLDAKLDQRVTQLDAKLDQRVTQLDAKLDQRVTQLDAKLELRLAESDAKWEQRVGDLKTSLVLWMFGFWTASTFIILGTTLAILRL